MTRVRFPSSPPCVRRPPRLRGGLRRPPKTETGGRSRSSSRPPLADIPIYGYPDAKRATHTRREGNLMNQSSAAPAASTSLRRRRVYAVLAGGLVLGVGAAVTLAAWNDS